MVIRVERLRHPAAAASSESAFRRRRIIRIGRHAGVSSRRLRTKHFITVDRIGRRIRRAERTPGGEGAHMPEHVGLVAGPRRLKTEVGQLLLWYLERREMPIAVDGLLEAREALLHVPRMRRAVVFRMLGML